MKSTSVSRLLVFTFLFWISPSAGNAQSYFQKIYYSSPYDQEGQDVWPMPDGGFLIAGYTGNSTVNDMDIEIIKTDAQGDLVWKKTYGGSKPDFPYRMLPTADGNYFIIGYSQSYGGGDYDVLLLKIDPQGNLIWLKTYGGWGNDQGSEIIATADGNYLIVGHSNSLAMADQDVYLLKIDPNGMVIWDKWWGGGNNDYGSSVKQCPDGGYIIVGTTFSAGTAGDAYLVKIDGAGNFGWSQNFGGSLYDEGVFINAHSDGSFVFLVRDSSSVGRDIDARVIKADAAGNVLWNKVYGGTRKDTPKMIQPTMDGGYVIAAITRSFGLINPDMWILKLDAAGDTTWTRRYGGFQNEHCYVVRELADGSFIATGKTTSYSPNFETIFLKLNPIGTLDIKVNDNASSSSFSVYPNPTSGPLNLDLRGIPALKRICISDLTGREVYIQEELANEKKEISLEGLGAGVYFVTVQSEFRTYTQKLILR